MWVGAAVSHLVTNFGAVGVLPWWDLRCVVASKLGAQGVDVILARAADAAHGSTMGAVETHHGLWKLMEVAVSSQR